VNELNILLHRAWVQTAATPLEASHEKGARRVDYNQIGQTAGTIWTRLSENGPKRFAALMEESGVPDSLFFMAIGWLSREEKLEFEADNGDYLVRLK
jgi:Winged helix-turn-helix domain (DUF2582)